MSPKGAILYEDRGISLKDLVIGSLFFLAAVVIVLAVLSGQPGNNMFVGIGIFLLVGAVFFYGGFHSVQVTEDRLYFSHGITNATYLYVGLKNIYVVPMANGWRKSRNLVNVQVKGKPISATVEGRTPARWWKASHAILIEDKDERLNYLFAHPDAIKIVELANQQQQKPRS